MSDALITLDQCLFGYEDGHRLLASSMPLSDETSSLTELSDLAPGAIFGNSDSYWTGIPAPKINRYALMRTWPAPEMLRPGCVWTHALLMDPELFSDIADLSVLKVYTARPKKPSDISYYRKKIGVDYEAVAYLFPPERLNKIDVDELVAKLYSTSMPVVGVSSPGQSDAAVFGVWSQQWPRLRRNFRFQTAVTRGSRTSASRRFDLTFQLERSSDEDDRLPKFKWVSAVAVDIIENAAGDLRTFLWRYGQDVLRQRGSFRPLVNIKMLHDSSDENTGRRAIDLVLRHFRDPKDAILLKQDMVDGRVVPHAQLDVLRFVLVQGGDNVFPPPTLDGVGRLSLLWAERPADLLQLAESLAESKNELGESVFQTVTSALPAGEFWTLTTSYPRVRQRMLAARPELIASEGVLTLDNAELSSLIALIPSYTAAVGALIEQLLSRDDTKLAQAAIERFPGVVAHRVVCAADEASASVGRAWLRSLVDRPEILLDTIVMVRISRTSLLFDFAEALGWLSLKVVAAGCDPWRAALVGIKNDLPDDKRDTLYAFVVSLALVTNEESGEILLRHFFDNVHEQIMKSRLPWRAQDILSPLLPKLGWSRGWDFALRLRLAVAETFVRNQYSVESYARLTKNRKTRLMLADAALEIPNGKTYARAAEDLY